MRRLPSDGLNWFIAARGIVAIALAIAVAGSAAAQQPEPTDKHWHQSKYFHDQRAYPLLRIPAGAYEAAQRTYRQQFARPAQAAPAISANAWTPIGPDHIATFPTTSGRLNSIAVHPTNSNIIYAAGAQGGVWKTTDGGMSWTPLTDNQCSIAMGALAIDPVNPSIVYAGTGEENFSLDSYYGCGVLRSTDGGTTWTQLGASTFVFAGGGGQKISRVYIDSATAGSATGTTVLVSASSGVYRSTDSGNSWTLVLAGTATDIVGTPTRAATLYAALGNIFGSASNGVYLSTDTGATWTKETGGLPTTNVGRINLAIAPSAADNVYASVQDTSTFALLGIWKSTSGGAIWTQVSATGASCASQCWYDMAINVDPTNANTVYFSGFSVYKSTDGGSNFSDIGSSIHVDQHALVFQPGNASTIYAGNDGGIFKSTDGGSTWTSLNSNIAITQFYPGISLHPTNASIAMGGTQDNGTNLYTGASVWNPVLGGDGGFSAIDFTTPTTGYATVEWGFPSFSGVYKTTNLGVSASFTRQITGLNLSDRGLFIAPVVMSPANSQQLFLGTYRLYQSTNGAASWSVISPDLSNGNGDISAIAQSKSNTQVIYVGTSDGNVQVTINGGASWTLATTGLPNRHVTYLAVDPTNAQNAFAVVSGFGTGHVFKTANGGTSWSDISANLPNIPVNAILLDPSAPTTNLYLGTDLGIFTTTNGGASWAAFNNGLPNVAVIDLAFNQATNVLLAATHGRGVWQATFVNPPSLQVSPATDMAASGSQGGPFSPASFQYQLSASSGSIGFSITGVPSWLDASTTSGTLTTSATSVTFTVNASANSLSPGSYGPVTITFTNTTNGQGNTTRSATLTVNALPALQVSPATNMAASGNTGGPFSPASFQYQLGASTGSASYSVSGVPSWLTPSATSGTVTTSPSTVTFTVNASANGIAPGTYGPTTITFTNTTNGLGNTTRTATLVVNPSGGGGGLSNASAYVDPRTGADSISCGAQTQPCATLNQALQNSNPGATIEILSGGVFGPVLFAAGASIVGPADQSAVIQWSPAALPGCIGGGPGSCNGFASANYAVEIAAGAADMVNLKNVTLDNAGNSLGALKVGNARALALDGVVVRGGSGAIAQMVAVQPNTGSQFQLDLSRCDIAFSATGGGLLIQPQGSTSVSAELSNSAIHNVKFGVQLDATALTGGGAGIQAVFDAMEFFSINNSAISVSAAGAGFARANLSRSTILNTGGAAVKVNGANAVGALYQDVITGSSAGVNVLGGASMFSLGNNQIYGNGNNCLVSPRGAAAR